VNPAPIFSETPASLAEHRLDGLARAFLSRLRRACGGEQGPDRFIPPRGFFSAGTLTLSASAKGTSTAEFDGLASGGTGIGTLGPPVATAFFETARSSSQALLLLREGRLAEALASWAEQTVPKLSRKSELAAAFRYMRARWAALVRCFDVRV
jgi:hypothetical protein